MLIRSVLIMDSRGSLGIVQWSAQRYSVILLFLYIGDKDFLHRLVIVCPTKLPLPPKRKYTFIIGTVSLQ